VRGDVLSARVPPADLTLAYNFSFFVFKDTRAAPAVLPRGAPGPWEGRRPDARHVRGTEACEAMTETRRIAAKQAVDGTRLPAFRYVWEQERFNPVTHDLFCSIHLKCRGVV
jgi:hypothetical protein